MINLGIVMDPIDKIHIASEASFAMLLAAQARGWNLWYMELNDLWLRDGRAYANMRALQVRDDSKDWFTLNAAQVAPLNTLNVMLMRKDPPFNFEYLITTYILEQAELEGVWVINKPQSLRDTNEKMAISWFPQCCVPTLVTRRREELRRFLQEQGEIILKPLDNMCGYSIFKVTQGDVNTSVIFEMMTERDQRFVMAQRFIPEIEQGDRRIILIDGEPIPEVLVRIPAIGEIRGNIAAGGHAAGGILTERERWICEQLAPVLRQKGLFFVGLDVIGGYLTEINVTSPGGVRYIDKLSNQDIASKLMDVIAAKLSKS
jgi:glutathione synthase